MIEWIVSSAVLILVIVVLRRLLKGKISLRLQYALWAIVLVRLLVPVSFGQSKLSVQNAVQAEQAVQAEPGEEAALPEFTIDIPPSRVDYVPPDLAISEPDPSLPKAEQEQRYEQNKQQWQDIMDADWEEYKAEHTRHVTLSVPDILRVLWLAGIAAVALVFLISNLRFGRRLRRSRQVLAADCPLPVYLSEAVETPCLFGLFRPAIYVTSEVAGDEAALSHVLAHETTHFRHWDHLWAVLRCVCLAVHWYNPLVWLAASLSRRDAELACDDGAIRRIGEGERAAYGRTLIGLTCAHRGNLLHTATTMTGSKKSIKERIVLIAKKPKMAVYTLIAVILIAAVAVGCTFTGAKGRSVQDITEENGYTITEQSKYTYMVTIPKEKLPDSIYTAEGHTFKENEVVVYETETTVIYLESVQLSNESVEQLYVTLNFSYRDLPENGTILLPYRKNPEGTFSSFSDLSWLAVTDDTGLFPHAVTLRGSGPEKQIVFYMSVDACKQADDVIRFETWCYEIEYKKGEHEFGSYTGEISDEESIPDAVREYAKTAMNEHRNEFNADVTVGEDYELTCLNTGTAGNDFSVDVWRLDYALNHSRTVENNKLTYGSINYVRFLMVHHDHMTGEMTLLEVLTDEQLRERYNTPELLAKYGDMYVAAAMELYHAWRTDTQLTSGTEQLLKQAYIDIVLKDMEGTPALDRIEIERYYGRYGDAYVVLMHGYIAYTDAPWLEEVDGVKFAYPDSRRIRTYTGEDFCTLEEAFKRGLLTHADLEQIARLHKAHQQSTAEERTVAYFQDLLAWDAGETWYNGALTCVYDSPENLNLYYAFHTAFPGGEEWHEFTAEEQAWLISEGEKKNLGFGHLPAQKRPAKQLDALLQQYFGVSLDQVQMPDGWVYYEATDSYYSSHGDTHVMQFFTVTKVEQGADGLIYVYYTAEGPIFRQDGTSLDGWEHNMVLTLEIQASKLTNPHGYAVVANQTLSDFEAFAAAAEKAVDPAQISVRAKTPYQAAGNYVAAWGGAYAAQMPYFIRDYRLIDWGVEEISADGKAVAGWLNCSILPTREYNVEGGIEFFARNAGYLNGSFSFVLEEQDGIWTVAGWDRWYGISLEDCGYTPMEGIESTVTGFLNEYLTELYCYTNSKWLDYTTGGIHLYSVDELSEQDQAIVWAADRNISYLEDKATYWKLARRGTNHTNFTIEYDEMKISQKGNRATVKVDAWMSFVYEGSTEGSSLQEQYEIELAKINGVWLITDVMQEVFWFDYEYKNNREALDKEIEHWESFSASKIQQYDLNSDGMIQSVEFPYAEGEAFGLTGEYATLYTAVAEYVMRWSGNALGGSDLILPRIARVYGKYEDKDGNVNYICGMNTMYYYGLGSVPGQWPANDTGGAGDFILATLDPDGNLVGFKTSPDGMGSDDWNQLYREYCGPLKDLAEAFINGTEDDYAEELMTEYKNEGPRLAQYLSYYFGE